MSVRSVVLTYHAVGPTPRGPLRHGFVPVELFERQMQFLAGRRQVVQLADLLAPAPQRGPVRVAITFDDAYCSVIERAAPILERAGLPATVFAPTAWLGDRNRWDPSSELELDLMSGDQLVELSRRGFEIGSHGHRHIDFSRSSEQEVREDLRASIDRLTGLLGRAPRFLAYPYGRSNRAARAAVREAGFSEAFALEWDDQPFARTRTPVFPHDSGLRFAFKASGRYAPLRRSRAVEAAYSRLVRPLRPDRRAADRVR
jgi:peptidoglycan/xylan/chitin deacetylase (PgdA/CDA1 family)